MFWENVVQALFARQKSNQSKMKINDLCGDYVRCLALSLKIHYLRPEECTCIKPLCNEQQLQHRHGSQLEVVTQHM